MATIVIPLPRPGALPAGEGDAGALEERETLEWTLEEVRLLLRQEEGRGADEEDGEDPAATVREPFWVVPWTEAARRPAAGPRASPLTMGSGHPKSFEERLRDRFEMGIAHLSGSAGNPMVLVVPLLVAASPTEVQAASERLHAVSEALEAIALQISQLGLRAGVLNAARYRFLPWCWGLAGDAAWPRALFCGPRTLGAETVSPVIYTSLTAGESLLRWEGYGRVRLQADLLMLHALSADGNELERRFPLAPGEHSRRFFGVSSALFAYPLHNLIREQVFTRLEQHPTEGGPLPDILHLDMQRYDARAWASDHMGKPIADLEAVLERDEIEPGRMGTSLAVSAGSLERTREDFSAVSARRRAGDVHAQLVGKLSGFVDSSLESATREALSAARRSTRTVLGDVDRTLLRAFGVKGAGGERETRNEGAEGGDEASRAPTVAGAMRTIAALDEGIGRLDALERKVESPEPLGRIVAAAAGVRQVWLGAEEALYREGSRTPARVAVVLETAVVFLAILLGSLFLGGTFKGLQAPVGPLGTAICLLLAAGGAALLFWLRERGVEEYLARWRALADHFRSETSGFAERLRRMLNDRVRLAKSGITTETKTALDAVRTRFRTELSGFRSVVEVEIDAIKKIQARAEEPLGPSASEEAGTFVLSFPEVPKPRLDLGRLHDELGGLLKPVLKTSDVPARVPIEEYREVLSRVARKSLAKPEDLVEQFRDRAAQLLRRAVAFAADHRHMPVGDARAIAVAEPFVIVGSLVEKRLEGAEKGAGAQVIGTRAVQGAFPAELAVAARVCPLTAPPGLTP